MKIEPVSTTSSEGSRLPSSLPTTPLLSAKSPVNYILGNDGGGSVVMEFVRARKWTYIRKASFDEEEN